MAPSEKTQARTELAWIEKFEVERQTILAEAKAKAKLLKSQINTIAKYALETTKGEEQHYLASLFYWEYKGIINANMIANAVGLKHGNMLCNWVYPATREVECTRCGKIFPKPISSRQYINWNHRVAWCPLCEEKIQREHKRRLESLQSQPNVATLKSMPYSEYLKTEHWQGRRKAALNRAKYRCQVCNTNERTLHVHHRTYENRGEERASDTIVLCEVCHKTFHDAGSLAS